MGFLPARRGRNRNAAGYGAGAAASTWMRAVDALSGERADRGAGLTSRRITCMTTAGISSEQLPQPAQGRDDREQVRLMWLASRVGIRPVSQTHAGRVPLVPPIGGGYKAQHANDGADREDAPCSLSWALSLPRDHRSVPVARHLVRAGMLILGVDEDCTNDVEVALSEACTNVLQHVRPDRRLPSPAAPGRPAMAAADQRSSTVALPAPSDGSRPQPSDQQCRARPRTGLDAGADGPGGVPIGAGGRLGGVAGKAPHLHRHRTPRPGAGPVAAQRQPSRWCGGPGDEHRGELPRRRALHRPAQAPRGSATARPPALAGSSRQAGSLARSPWAVKPPSAVPPSANCGSPPAFHHPRPPAMRLRMPVPWSPEGRTTTQLHGALVVVVALAVAVVRSPVVAPLVAATGRLGAAAPLGPVAGQA